MRHFSGPGRILETQIHQTRLNFQHWKSLSQILMIFLYMDVWFYIWQDCLQWFCTTSAAIQVQVKTDNEIIPGTQILLTSLAPSSYCEFSLSIQVEVYLSTEKFCLKNWQKSLFSRGSSVISFSRGTLNETSCYLMQFAIIQHQLQYWTKPY